MIRPLTKTGTSRALVITKEMKAHLRLDSDTIEVEYRDGSIVLTKPISMAEAIQRTVEQYDTALRNLAK